MLHQVHKDRLHSLMASRARITAQFKEEYARYNEECDRREAQQAENERVQREALERRVFELRKEAPEALGVVFPDTATAVAKRPASKERDAGYGCEQPIGNNAPEFFSNIDTSAGPDACHLWTGAKRRNSKNGVDDGRICTYFHGLYKVKDLPTTIATRVLCFYLFGRTPPADKHITPTCSNHLCCNPKHLRVTPQGGRWAAKVAAGVPLEQFFCEPVGAK